MYEQFRNEFLSELVELDANDLKTPTQALDNVAENWNFEPACTDIAIYGREEAIQFAKAFLASKKLEGKSEETINNMGYMLKNLIFSLNKPLKDVTTNDMRFYLAYYQKQRSISDEYLDHMRGLFKGFFGWLVTEEYLEKNPMMRIAKIKYDQNLRHALDLDQLNTLRKACTDDRDRAIVEFLYSTGARVAELCSVRLSDINFEKKEVILFGKGRKQRISYLSNTAVKALKAWLANRPHDSVYLFNNIRGGSQMKRENVEKIFRRLSTSSGLRKVMRVTPHVIRHTTATQALENGMPVEEVQRLLGHAKISTTMIYIDLTDKRVKERHRQIFD